MERLLIKNFITMDYIQNEYQELLKIYSSDIPDFIMPFLKSPALQRMS
jgi:hypothetical protein